MSISQQATKGHLIVGSILVLLSLASFIATLFLDSTILTFLIFFFGVWGGVELGRYLEHWMATRNPAA
jgi:hypothetical protein